MMALDFDRIKNMDQSVQYSVNGYVRKCQKLFPSNNAYYDIHGHSIIISCILLFFDEPEVFEINNTNSFKYIVTEHGDLFHIFGKKKIDRKYVKTHKWMIETNEEFAGTFGIMDYKHIDTVKNGHGKYLWYSHMKHMASVGSKNQGFSAKIFETTSTTSFVSKKGGDTITIELDYDNDKVTFSSKKKNETRTGKLKKGLEAVKFFAEFNYFDSEMKIKAVYDQ